MTAEELENHLESGQNPLIFDVRSDSEFNLGHIEGAIHAPLTSILKTAQVYANRKDDLVILVCEHGPRAQLARGLLKFKGYKRIDLLDGHMSRWRQSGRALKKGQQ